MGDTKLVPAVEKAANILQLLSYESDSPMGITEIASRLSLSKGTVHSILLTLLHYELVEKCPITGKYSLGSRVLSLSSAYEKKGNRIESFMKIAKNIRLTCLDNINYSILKGFNNMVLASLPAVDHSLRVELPVGAITPSICSSSGKLLISQFDDKLIEEIYSQQYMQYTNNTISTKEEFLKEIHLARENGYAINNAEYEDGICSVGAPVKNINGKIIAAINIVVPEVRFDPSSKEVLINLVVNGAVELSKLC